MSVTETSLPHVHLLRMAPSRKVGKVDKARHGELGGRAWVHQS